MASILATNFARLRIPLKDVEKATNYFDPVNIIGTGQFGPAYKGELLLTGNLNKIVALRLDRKFGLGDVEFWTEISMLSDLRRIYLVYLIGFCDEKDEKIILIRREANGSLMEHLNSVNLKSWTRRLRISIGVARALSYLHNDGKRGYGVIHRNINSSTILLDEDWEPKLSGFAFSVKQAVNRMEQVVPCEPIGIAGYVDPEIENIKGASFKSDIYSFGVVLFEILCGRAAYIENEANEFLAPLAKEHYEKKTMQEIIHSDLWNQMSPLSLIKYSEIAYSCLKAEGERRPNIEYIVTQLEKALELQLQRENIINNLEHLKIPHNEIQLATNNFSKTYRIRSSEYFNLYRAELDHYAIEGSSSTTRKNVAIKQIISRDDGQGEEYFYNSLEKLTSVKHRNIVALLRFCLEGSNMILVIEDFCNGYLDDYLGNVNRMGVLTWGKRLQICTDVAHALNYLHYENKRENKKIVLNRDIGRHTIGLDENWREKITEFGFSEFLPSNVKIEGLYSKHRGKVCYLDPYDTVSFLRVEADVYSFGVVLYEILCGRTADDPIYSEKGLANVANRAYSKGTLVKMIDPKIKEIGQKYFDRLLYEFDSIAGRCVSDEVVMRPSMEGVVKELESQLEKTLQVKELISEVD